MGADPEVVVRKAGPSDRDELYPLAKELATSFELSGSTFAESFSGLISDPDALVLVAVDERSGQLIGYLLGFRHRTFFADAPVGWVEEIHTRSDRRREGVAGALTLEYEKWAGDGGARLVALATRRARAFYEAIGYEDSAVYFRKLAPN
jgi:GNAT superfamily N-acetyltransferase